MIEYVDEQGQAFELPKMTMKLSAEMDKVTQAQDANARFKAEYEFVKKTLPKEYVGQRLCGTRVEDVDLVELSVLYQEINSTYAKPVIEAQMAAASAQMEKVQPILDAANSVASISAINGKRGRQAFRIA